MATNLAFAFPASSSSMARVLDQLGPDHTIIGTSDAMRYVMQQVEEVAPTNATVLLLGESGTGKELVARAIHLRSPRRLRNVVVVDCGALPATLIESELFGRERGAFTGAHSSQAGRFERANGGTLFFDEIGELPLELQPKLLRVLQERQVERLGGTGMVNVDVRIVAATNRNLADEVRRGRFRLDLFYRLSVFPITLPALRQRREDLPALVLYLANRIGRMLAKPVNRITSATLQALERYDWPGNIRELENVLYRAVILSRDGVLDLPDFVGESIDITSPPRGTSRPLVEVERDHIQLVLERSGWRIGGPSGAARVLGLRPRALRTRMRKYGIAPPEMAAGASL